MGNTVPKPKQPAPGLTKKPGERKERKPVMPLLPGESLGMGAKVRKDFMDLSNQNPIYKTY